MTNSRTVADRAIFIGRRLVQRGVMVKKKGWMVLCSGIRQLPSSTVCIFRVFRRGIVRCAVHCDGIGSAGMGNNIVARKLTAGILLA